MPAASLTAPIPSSATRAPGHRRARRSAPRRQYGQTALPPFLLPGAADRPLRARHAPPGQSHADAATHATYPAAPDAPREPATPRADAPRPPDRNARAGAAPESPRRPPRGSDASGRGPWSSSFLPATNILGESPGTGDGGSAPMPSQRDVVVLLPGQILLLVAQRRKGSADPHPRAARLDHLVDEPALGGNEGVGKAVFVALGMRRDLLGVVQIRAIDDLG